MVHAYSLRCTYFFRDTLHGVTVLGGRFAKDYVVPTIYDNIMARIELTNPKVLLTPDPNLACSLLRLTEAA